jgi:hypothetical protein
MIPRRVAAAWDRINHHSRPEPAPSLAEQRLPRVIRLTRVALAYDIHWTTGQAVCHLEEWDREYVSHLVTLADRNDLLTQATEQLEVQS